MNAGGLKIITKVRHRVELENCKMHLDKFLNAKMPVIKFLFFLKLVNFEID